MINFQEDEHVQFLIRKHWFVFLADLIVVLLLLIVFVAIATMLFTLHASGYLSGNTLSLGIFIVSNVLLFVWVAGFIIWTDYYLDILIVTNKRIIDIEQRGLFSRELASSRLDKIQDVTSEVDGIIPTLLKFGTLHIQTAGESREFLVKGVPNAFEVRDRIAVEQEKVLEAQTISLSEESLSHIKKSMADD